MIFKLNTANLNNFKKFKFSKNGNFKADLIEKLKRQINMIYKLNTANLNNFKKFKFSKNEKFQRPPYTENKETLKI